MVPTDTMLGRLTPDVRCGASAKLRSPRRAIMALPAAPRPGAATAERAAGRPTTHVTPPASTRRGGARVRGSRQRAADGPSHPRLPDGDAHGQLRPPRRGNDAPQRPAALTVLLYSDDSDVREAVRARGRPPAGAATCRRWRWTEVRHGGRPCAAADAGGRDVLVLDGEAVPAGGMGVCKQLKDEIYRCPPILVLTGRPADAWLATWSRADLAVPHPLDPAAVAAAVAELAARAGYGWRDGRPDLGGRPAPEATWPRPAHATLLAGEDLTRDADRVGDGPGHGGRGEPGAGGRFPRRAARQGRDVEELTRLSGTMLGTPSGSRCPGDCVDVVGTGGDRPHTVNISTMAALVVAGAGRRGWSSTATGRRPRRRGAADVLEALGVRLDLPPQRVAELAEEVGITFCFAQAVPPVVPARGRGRAASSASRPPSTSSAR